MAGLPEEDEPKLMPFGFAVHDESFFRVPEWHGLQVRSGSKSPAKLPMKISSLQAGYSALQHDRSDAGMGKSEQ